MEKIEARVSKSWAIRMTLAGIAFVAFGLASLYDGKIRYPAVNQDFRHFIADYVGEQPETLKTVYGPNDDVSVFDGLCVRWNAYWKDSRQGWLQRRSWKDMDQSKLLSRKVTPAGIPEKIALVDYIYSDWDLRTQLLMAVVCLPVGLVILFRLIRALPRRIAADNQTLYAANGKAIPFSDITEIDKKRWDRKAIAVVHYRMEDGTSGKAIVDDWIYKGADAILDRVEEATERKTPATAAPAEEKTGD